MLIQSNRPATGALISGVLFLGLVLTLAILAVKLLDGDHQHVTRIQIEDMKNRCQSEGGSWTAEVSQSQWGSHDFYETYRCAWPPKELW